MGGTASSRNFAESVINQSVSQVNTAAQNSSATAFSFQNISKTGGVGDMTVRRTKMRAKVEVNLTAMFDAQQSNAAQQDASQSLEQMAKASVSGVNLGNASSVINEVRTAVNSVISGRNEMLQNCRAEALAVQNISMTNVDGNLLVEDVEMETAVSSTLNCIGKAVQENSAVQKAQQAISQSATAETIGLDLSAFFLIFVLIAGGLVVCAVIFVMVGGSVFKGFASTSTKIISGLTNPKTLIIVSVLITLVFVYVFFFSDLTNATPRVTQADGTVKPMSLGDMNEDPFLYPFLKPQVLRGQDDPEPPAPGQLPRTYKMESKLKSVETGTANSIDELRGKLFAVDALGKVDAKYADVTTIYWNTFTKEYEMFEGKPSFELWQMWKPETNPRPEFQKMRITPDGQPGGYCNPSDPDFNDDKICKAIGGNEVFSDNPRYFNTTKYNMMQLAGTAQDLLDRLLCVMINIFGHMDAITANTNKKSFYEQCTRAEEALLKMASDQDSERNASLPGWTVGAAGSVADFFTGGGGGSAFANLADEIKERKEQLMNTYRFPDEAVVNPDPRVTWAILFGNGVKNPHRTGAPTIDPQMAARSTSAWWSGETAAGPSATNPTNSATTVRICVGFTKDDQDPRSAAAVDRNQETSACNNVSSIKDIESVVSKLQHLRSRVLPIQDELYAKISGWNRIGVPATIREKARVSTQALLDQWDRDFETWWQQYEKGFDHFNTGNVSRGLGDIRDITMIFTSRIFPGKRMINIQGVPGGSQDTSPALLIGIIGGVVGFVVASGLLLRKINNAKALSLRLREGSEAAMDKTKELIAKIKEKKAQMAYKKLEAKLEKGDLDGTDESVEQLTQQVEQQPQPQKPEPNPESKP
jgi:hypothetical protein